MLLRVGNQAGSKLPVHAASTRIYYQDDRDLEEDLPHRRFRRGLVETSLMGVCGDHVNYLGTHIIDTLRHGVAGGLV